MPYSLTRAEIARNTHARNARLHDLRRDCPADARGVLRLIPAALNADTRGHRQAWQIVTSHGGTHVSAPISTSKTNALRLLFVLSFQPLDALRNWQRVSAIRNHLFGAE